MKRLWNHPAVVNSRQSWGCGRRRVDELFEHTHMEHIMETSTLWQFQTHRDVVDDLRCDIQVTRFIKTKPWM
ncbi:hypothetical protein PAHAL_7G053300 [Panicum hallii]|uniref:Uncharacterized protein n=1 Tax=Panicum hallii TaxID=206008 RepID=A0A2T8IB10_9POAL|nr:hypothetical protein PAHAL_7G053300 [Panicum hallii]